MGCHCKFIIKRCVCFAEQLAKTAELPLLVNHDLKEMYFGEWEGISTQQIYETSPELLANFWQNQVNIVHLAQKH